MKWLRVSVTSGTPLGYTVSVHRDTDTTRCCAERECRHKALRDEVVKADQSATRVPGLVRAVALDQNASEFLVGYAETRVFRAGAGLAARLEQVFAQVDALSRRLAIAREAGDGELARKVSHVRAARLRLVRNMVDKLHHDIIEYLTTRCVCMRVCGARVRPRSHERARVGLTLCCCRASWCPRWSRACTP